VQGTEADFSILLFVSPIVLWLVCLFFAVRVITPETYKTNLSSPELAEQLYLDLVSYKHRNLKRAYWAFLAGFVPLVVAGVYCLRLLDGPGWYSKAEINQCFDFAASRLRVKPDPG